MTTVQDTTNFLTRPIRIGNLEIANRMVMGPMAITAPEADGGPSEQTIALFEARARGGFGLIIVGGMTATKRAVEECSISRTLRMDLEELVPRYAKLTTTMHRHGVPIIAQLTPGFGTMGVPGPGRPTISASPRSLTIAESAFPRGFIVPGGRTTAVSEEATREEIGIYVREMMDSCERARRAGFDGVEIPCHMSYFLNSFISPRTNWRTDEYGGSLENRARVLTEILSGIRGRMPKGDFVLGLRMPVNDYMPDGMGVQGYLEVAAS